MVLTQQNIIQQVPHKQSILLQAILKKYNAGLLSVEFSLMLLDFGDFNWIFPVFSPGLLMNSEACLPHPHRNEMMIEEIMYWYFPPGFAKSAHAVCLMPSGRIMPTPTCGVVAAYLQSD